ncbi:PD-(D/E)XK nuclease family protein [Bombilactobacillus folatiphilus]|uniref:PD-(D/E)XK nuclease family protein n=1 Tax=Bombilactobacillus folatiphilus TaxID=2923362 RepID=A0ABY4P715_9LACO|nr:PD-(D/E)XK nuclease family protein [Bombilactobacillus folatiphilus]UQS81499.1 PD-(D/E)XK nuclease family protein [Bombilactobacillus folatiphilus]
MSVKFVLGAAQKDKRAILLADLNQKMQQNLQDTFIWLTPDHIKFDSEVQILTHLKQDTHTTLATNRLQVFSFSRLAWYYLRNDPIYQSPQLTGTTQVMLLAKIVRQLAPKLHLYAGEAKRIGFIENLQQQVDLLLTNHLTPQRLTEFAQQVRNQGDLDLKLDDLALIYEQYLQKTTAQYNDEYQLLNLLNNYLKTDANQIKVHYFVSDFTQFSLQELQIIMTLMTQAADVELSLTLDRPYSEDQTNIFFQQPIKFFQKLTQTARQRQIPFTTQVAEQTRVNVDLQLVENFWMQQNNRLQTLDTQMLQDNSSVQIWQAATMQQEIVAVTTYIRQLVATQGYRYKDFLVLARNLGDYQQFLDPYFQMQQISYFLDLPHSMRDHAFKSLIDSLFALLQNNLQYHDVMTLLRTELVIPKGWTLDQYRQAVDLTDNYCLAHGIRAHDWRQKTDFVSPAQHSSLESQQQFAQINGIKHLITQIDQALRKMTQKATSVRDACAQLYQLLDKLQVFKTLKQWETTAIEAGDLVLSQQPEQVVNTFTQILDEFVELFGTDEFVLEDFLVVLDNGFDKAQYLTIPAVLDAVQISNLALVQPTGRKITLILGADDQNMPQVNPIGGVLSDDDLVHLQPLLRDTETLPQTQEQLNSNEPYVHDLAFLSSSERLIFTYARTKQVTAMQLSPYVQLLKQRFQLTEQIIDFTQPTEEEQVLQLLGSPIMTADHLLAVYRKSKTDQTPVAPAWQYVKDLIFQSSTAAQIYLSKIWRGLSYQNIAVSLDLKISQALYGSQLLASISQLETFYRNPYEYFLKYGLHLKPRPQFKITPANQGTFFHEVLDLTVKQLQSQNQSWADLSAKTLQQVSQQIVQQVLQQPAYQIFTHDEQFIQQHMIETVQRSLEVLRQQTQQAQFYPLKTEVTFGQVGAEHNLEPLKFALDDQKSVIVRGRIDRIDQLMSDPHYYMVVDYKSGQQDFKFQEFAAGLNLQMLTYLASLLNDSSLLAQDMLPVGGFYFHIQDSTVNLESLKGDLTKAPAALFKQYQYKGLIIDDGHSSEILDPAAEQQASQVFQIARNRRLNANKVVNQDEFQQLLAFNQQLIVQAANAILKGQNQISPLRLDEKKTTLQYSDYLPIMQFDAMLPENNYRLMPKLNRKQFFEQLNLKEQPHGKI